MMADAIAATPAFRREELAGWQTLRIAGWHWLIRPDQLHELQFHPALSPTLVSTGELIKRGPQRTVRRFPALTALGSYFLKQFHPPDWRTRWKHLLRGGQAQWEFSRYRLAVERGIPTADVVAVGRDAAWSGDSALVTQGLEDVAPLDEWLRQRPCAPPLPLRRRLAEQLGELIARLHAHGVVHRDLHAGNILIRCQAGELRLWLVDLAPLRFRRQSASPAAIGQNLGRLRHSLLEQLNLVDHAAFFQAYWREFAARVFDHTIPWHGDQHSAWRDLSRRCEIVARRAWDDMDRAWARGNSKEILITTPTVHCRGLARLGRERLEALCRFADANDSADMSIPISTRRIPSQDGEQPLEIITRREPKSPVASEFSWARRCWEIGHALECRWIAAPVPVYMLEHHSPGAAWQELALTTDSGWKPLTNIFTRTSAVDEIAPRVIDLLNRFHDLGFTHDSLSLAAFEVRMVSHRWQCRFAALDSIHQTRSVSWPRRCANLQPLVMDIVTHCDVSQTRRLRWLMRYLGQNDARHWKTCWRMMSPSLTSVPHRRAA